MASWRGMNVFRRTHAVPEGFHCSFCWSFGGIPPSRGQQPSQPITHSPALSRMERLHLHTHTHTGYCYVIWLCLHPCGSVSACPHQGCGRCRPVAREELWGCWGWLGLLFSAGLWWAPARSLQRILGIEAVAMGWKGRMHSVLQQKDIQLKSINIYFTIFYTTGQKEYRNTFAISNILK